jgi:hypothetical protein
LVEPDVFHAGAAEDAIDHDRQTLHAGVPAGCAPVVKDDRPGAPRRQLRSDLPEQPLALCLIGIERLAIDQCVDPGIAVAVVVQLAAAPVIEVQCRVGGPAAINPVSRKPVRKPR